MAAYTTIDNPELYFQAKKYTGTGSSNALTLDGSENMQPDLVWGKSISDTYDNFLFDAVRGTTNLISSNTNAAENDLSSAGVTAFGSDGFTVDGNPYNKSSDLYAAWCWKAGGSASSNSSGDITSSVSANTTAGFSIVTYTGNGSATQTIGHGLGAVPKMMIFKRRNSTSDWIVYHNTLGSTNYITLNSYGSTSAYEPYFANTDPTSSLFTVDTAGDINGSSDTFVSYCFAEKQGYSKIGKYTGNENTDGTFVYLGFRPAYVLFKKTTGSNANWQLWDNKRDPENPVESAAHPDAGAVPSTDQDISFLSNGFKLRTSASHLNADGVVYLYMAFAEAPFVNSNGVPCNAR